MMNTSIRPLFVLLILLTLAKAIFILFPANLLAFFSPLKESIIAYNLEHHQKILSNGSYRGEEGILLLRPEIARSFGLNVSMDRDYLYAETLFKKAGQTLETLKGALTTQDPKMVSDKHEMRIAQLALDYNSTLRSARETMMAYHRKLAPSVDDRLNNDICTELMEKLLYESAEEASCNLRETLALFYNKCRTLNRNSEPLKVENVRFVNYVVHEFKQKSEEKDTRLFDLDMQTVKSLEALGDRWQEALGNAESRYIPLLDAIMKERNPKEHSVNLLLFLAIIRQESNFNPHAVSHVGAAGLTQIMPRTAEALGMENIFVPPYLNEAGAMMRKERNLRNRAMRLILRVTQEDRLETARRARDLMQQSFDCRRKRIDLYARYRKEILDKRRDDRLEPRKAIEYGFKYFDNLMTDQEGDISLALAAYNAGPHRVKKYKGIPPYRETIGFRNRVLNHYRDYLRKLDLYQQRCPGSLEDTKFGNVLQQPEITEINQDALDMF